MRWIGGGEKGDWLRVREVPVPVFPGSRGKRREREPRSLVLSRLSHALKLEPAPHHNPTDRESKGRAGLVGAGRDGGAVAGIAT